MRGEVVLARLRGRVAEDGRERVDVALLVRADLDEAATGPVGKAGVGEVVLGVVGEGLVVKGVLEVLEGEGVVQDDGVCQGGSITFA